MSPGLMDFTGKWAVARVIEDRLGGPGRFEGEAMFAPDADGLLYTEVGQMRLGGGAPMRAERRYLWRDAGQGRIAVLFEDGRAFHTFEPGGEAADSHDCPPDMYHVRYDFSGWPVWSALWEVRGPRKDYRMETRYTRLPS